MIPLLLCSFLTWAILIERFFVFRRTQLALKGFHLEAMNLILRADAPALLRLCERERVLPTSRLVRLAYERLTSPDARVRSHWMQAVERERVSVNQELKSGLWVLGTIASAAPFIGLFGTVVGILQSFNQMAKSGTGGFTVVAGGISEALIATAAGIIVAVIAVLAFNAFQVRWQRLVLEIKHQMAEITEVLEGISDTGSRASRGSRGSESGA